MEWVQTSSSLVILDTGDDFSKFVYLHIPQVLNKNKCKKHRHKKKQKKKTKKNTKQDIAGYDFLYAHPKTLPNGYGKSFPS